MQVRLTPRKLPRSNGQRPGYETRTAVLGGWQGASATWELEVGSWESSPLTYRFTSITVVAVRPKISGVYISSARAGAVRKEPAVVARTT